MGIKEWLKGRSKPVLYSNRFEDCARIERIECKCLTPNFRYTKIHQPDTDLDSPAWNALLEAVAEAAIDKRTVFAPVQDIGPELWGQISTLPSSIATLKRVEHLQLYGSNLVEIPAAIGEMTSLRNFTPYTSYRLHWFPYEITRCAQLVDSTISTRALYGNEKNNLPFPKLRPNTGPEQFTCSVCGEEVECLMLRSWVTKRVATDNIPLLVRACSEGCIEEASRA